MSNENTKPAKKQDTQWAAVLWYIHLHVLGLYAIWVLFTSAKWMTTIFSIVITILGCVGVTLGAHRLWAHGSFKASGPLRLFLMLAHTLAGVGPIYDWVLYHRLHHKYYGTDKDPFNHNKGFWYSHYVSNIVAANVDYEEAKRLVDMRDVELDAYVWVQKRFYWIIFAIVGLLLPLNAPLEYWDEHMGITFLLAGFLRFAITVNTSWLVNSALLVWAIKGNKVPPDDISIFLVTKSFWPAYHYMVPWDWKSGEFGTYDSGCNTFLIKMLYELGFVTNLQTLEPDDVRDALHTIVSKKISITECLDMLKERGIYNAQKQKLITRY